MKIPSDTKYIRSISYEVEKLLRSKKIDESDIFDIRLCIEEALKNAIIHGNKLNKEFYVFISYALKGNEFVIEIEDEGAGYVPDKVPDPTKEENLLVDRGRGVFLIHKLMDEVKYNDKGNKIIMTKYINNHKGDNNAN